MTGSQTAYSPFPCERSHEPTPGAPRRCTRRNKDTEDQRTRPTGPERRRCPGPSHAGQYRRTDRPKTPPRRVAPRSPSPSAPRARDRDRRHHHDDRRRQRTAECPQPPTRHGRVGFTIQLAWSIVHHVGPLARAHPTGKVSESATTIRPAGASSMTVGSSTSTEVEAVRVQDFRERLDEVVDELLLAVARGIDLGDRAQLGV